MKVKKGHVHIKVRGTEKLKEEGIILCHSRAIVKETKMYVSGLSSINRDTSVLITNHTDSYNTVSCYNSRITTFLGGYFEKL